MRHLLGIEGLSAEDARAILARAGAFFDDERKGKPQSALAHRTVVNLFFEASTRTRTSFEIAAKRLGADVVNVSPQVSSVTKGETLLDTVRNLEAMRPFAIVLRHMVSGVPQFLAPRVHTSLVNAGDGSHEHPTQALLDAFTIKRHKGGIEGVVVAICGDILHSRVARSNALLLTMLGAKVRFAAPAPLLPARAAEAFGVEVFDRLEPALEGADVVMALRIQKERLAFAGLPGGGEYARTFGLHEGRLAGCRPDVIVMHPGPINRGVEMTSALADGSRSVILEQVEAGVAVRMAVLEWLLLDRA